MLEHREPKPHRGLLGAFGGIQIWTRFLLFLGIRVLHQPIQR
jgi:hypothetical protein